MSPRGQFPNFKSTSDRINTLLEDAKTKLAKISEEDRVRAINDTRSASDRLNEIMNNFQNKLNKSKLDDYNKNYTIPELVLATEDGWNLPKRVIDAFWNKLSNNKSGYEHGEDSFRYFKHNGYLFEVSLGSKISIPLNKPLQNFFFKDFKSFVATKKIYSSTSVVLFSDFDSVHKQTINLYLNVSINIYEFKDIEFTNKAVDVDLFQFQNMLLNLGMDLPIVDCKVEKTHNMNYDYRKAMRDATNNQFYSKDNGITKTSSITYDSFIQTLLNYLGVADLKKAG